MFGLKRVVYYEAWYLTFNDSRVSYFRSEVEMMRELIINYDSVTCYGSCCLSLDQAKDIFGSEEDKDS